MLIDNLWVWPGEYIEYYYNINGYFINATSLRIVFPVEDPLPSYYIHIPPFDIDPEYSDPIILFLRDNTEIPNEEDYYDESDEIPNPGIMIYQLDEDENLIEITPRPLGEYIAAQTNVLEVPVPGGNPTDRRYPTFNLLEADREIADQIEHKFQRLPGVVTNEDFDQILSDQNKTKPESSIFNSFQDITEMLQRGDIVGWEINPVMQLGLENTQNKVASFNDKHGQIYLVEVRYDPVTNNIFPPI